MGQNFAADSPDERCLLAMKLFAARQRDLDDAMYVSAPKRASPPVAAMRQPIDDAYNHNVIPPEIEAFIDDVAQGRGPARRIGKPRRSQCGPEPYQPRRGRTRSRLAPSHGQSAAP